MSGLKLWEGGGREGLVAVAMADGRGGITREEGGSVSKYVITDSIPNYYLWKGVNINMSISSSLASQDSEFKESKFVLCLRSVLYQSTH
jgi:hypothetical protein